MTFKPLNDLIVVDRDPIVTETAGGLLLASGSLQKPQSGTVVSVGKKVDGIVPGDRIFYSNRTGVEHKVDGETIFLIKEENVIGIFN